MKISPQEKVIDLFSFVPFATFSHKISYDEYNNADYIILGHMTSSFFLEEILIKGLLPPVLTNNYSNKTMFENGDENYIYLTAHLDRCFSQNAVEKYPGEEILLLVKIEIQSLELDDLKKYYSKQNIDLRNPEVLHHVLTTPTFDCNCRTKKHITPDSIIEVFKIKDLWNLPLIKIGRTIDKRVTYLAYRNMLTVNNQIVQ